jgi:hypothetical protein
MILRRAVEAGIMTRLGNHSFRATGITAYFYDRRREELSLDEVERIRM